MEMFSIGIAFEMLWIYYWMFGKLEHHSLYPNYAYAYIYRQ